MRDKELNCTYVSSPACLVKVTSDPSNLTLNPSTSTGIVEDFSNLRSVDISSFKNSTNSFSPKI